MKAKSKVPLCFLISLATVSVAGARVSVIFLSTFASFQNLRATEVNSSLTSQHQRWPSAGSALATERLE